ncbi:MAG: hypothetical protein IGQ88_05390 [Gloeomargaritaceae cyanobacterium C42_A2020_066]|nr:hypothetical protein [Gloeomargaritaceae cyanobacterium C42_A2020_066]
MSSSPDPRIQERLRRLMRAVEQEWQQTQSPPPVSPTSSPSQGQRLQRWYQSLPPAGRLIVLGGGVLGGLAVLSTVMRLVSLLISVGVLAGGAYLLYQFLKKPPSNG